MPSLIHRSGPFAWRNARLFVLFTTFYNARAYYPVLAVFFTDLGLTLQQYVLLNAVWAAAIFLLEVPSGALADVIGRKRLLVFSAALMVVEMAILLFAPKDGGMLLFALCMLNRFLSGASEAAASGADEAIAYDSLPAEGRAAAWDAVLATAMRWRAAGFLIAMTLGGLLYDPSWLNALLPENLALPVDLARRLPVALVFMQALVCLAICLRFDEDAPHAEHAAGRCRAAHELTLQTARKAFTTRSIAVILVGGFLIDAVTRNFATLVSEYYRLIGIPGWAFGVIGSFIAVGNWFIPAIAARVNQRFEPVAALALGGGVAALGLFLLVPAWPWLGLLPAMVLMMTLGYVSFTVSRHLHSVAESAQRATLLSVKGLVFNLAYGLYSLAFSLTLAGLGKSGGAAFQRALGWQAGFFAIVLLAYIAVALRRKK
ncbi:MAG: MFS transporter [Verrucomicrobiaceae bacterium]|nr:MAG: MFS transporter [Verrucomicrobiaceae bacterium]